MEYLQAQHVIFFQPEECKEFGVDPEMTPEKALFEVHDRHAGLHTDVRRGEEFAVESMYPAVLDRIRFMREQRDRFYGLANEIIDAAGGPMVDVCVEKLQALSD